MILPIVAYGDPVLRKVAEDIDSSYPELNRLIENMWSTMKEASGVGLAAPQVGHSIRLFIVDSAPMFDEHEQHLGIRKVFINAEMISEEGKEWPYEEGCLSIPGVREEVYRKPKIRIFYLDEHFNEHEESFDDLNARVIQHEYDHIEGILFPDKLKPLRKRLLQRQLGEISKGFAKVKYKMRFPGR
jgi:peptide deformylase